MNDLLYARADVSKCAPEGECPLQSMCLRNLRPPAPYQSYSMFEKWMTEACEGFIKYEDNKDLEAP